MKRGLVILAVIVLCVTQAAAKRTQRPRKPAARKQVAAAKPKAAPVKKAPPGAVDENSLGFGSTREDVLRLMGKPTRVARVAKREIWFYGLSTISLAYGKKVVAWSKYDRPLPVNIGSPKTDAPPIHTGASMEAVVAALGTPDTVAVQGQYQVWFFGTQTYAISNGKVVPAQIGTGEAAIPKTAPVTKAQPANPKQQQCWCPL